MAGDGRFSTVRVVSLSNKLYSSLFLKIRLLQQSVRSGYAPDFCRKSLDFHRPCRRAKLGYDV